MSTYAWAVILFLSMLSLSGLLFGLAAALLLALLHGGLEPDTREWLRLVVMACTPGAFFFCGMLFSEYMPDLRRGHDHG